MEYSCFNSVWAAIFNGFWYRILIDIKKMILKYQSVSQHFYSEWRLGDLLTRLFDDSAKLQETIKLFSSLLPQFAFMGVLVYLFNELKLTLFTMVSVPILFTISYLLQL